MLVAVYGGNDVFLLNRPLKFYLYKLPYIYERFGEFCGTLGRWSGCGFSLKKSVTILQKCLHKKQDIDII